MIAVDIGGEIIAVRGEPALMRALEKRYAGFVVPVAAASSSLQVVITPDFRGDYAEPAKLAVALYGSRLVLDGCASGELDLESGLGTLHNASNLGEVDAAMRALAATRAPLRGRLLLHGMITAARDGALVLAGESGAGKSTAREVLGGACDEVVAIHVETLRASATPYWNGHAFTAPLRAIGVLSRGGSRVVATRGATAVRMLAAHVVRYVAYPPTERALFAGLAALARSTVWVIEAPTGDAFSPFIRRVAATLVESTRVTEVQQ